MNRPLCPISTIVRKPKRAGELFRQPELKQLSENFYLYSPKYFIHDSVAKAAGPLEKLNIMALQSSFRNLFRVLGISEKAPLVWYYHPTQAYVTELFEGSFNIYELYDPLMTIAGQVDTKSVELESIHRSHVDLLITAAQGLHAEFGNFYKHSINIGNGIDRKTFAELTQSGRNSQSALNQISQPRIGYAGVIGDRLNWQLIREVADTRQDWNFVFVGRVDNEAIVHSFSSVKNVHFLPPVPEENISEILCHFDVGVLPYLTNEFFLYLNPLKYYELAASGVPIVSVVCNPISELSQAPAELVIAAENNVNAWIAAIDRQLNSDRQRVKVAGHAVALANLWEDKAESVLACVGRLLND
ncbi:MAG: glycosyltransferase [Candidatus Zixiibacteriota bacterium]